MTYTAINIKCPHCGAAVDTRMEICEFCDKPVIIKTINSVSTIPMAELNKYAMAYKRELSTNPNNPELNHSVAMCYMKLKQYKQAVHYFEMAMKDNFDDASNYFYAAICLLEGKKAFLAMRPVIEQIETYIQNAIEVEPQGIHYYLWAYIKYDYFKRKSFRTSPNYQECLAVANQLGISAYDKETMFELLGVQRPIEL